jgi:DNA-binding transcriptional MerR regulator
LRKKERSPVLRTGEVAKRTGLTARTLHHWDRIGLLRPSGRSPSGYRLYGDADIERLQRIVSLRELGLALADIRECLDTPGYELPRVLRLQLERVRNTMDRQRRLAQRLESLLAKLEGTESVSVDEYLQTIGMTIMYEKYYTEEQLEELRQRAENVGEARMREVQEEWPKLIAEVRAEMEQGTDPSSERAQALARRWQGLIEEFTGGNPAILASLKRLYREEPSAHEQAGVDPAVSGWIGRAMGAR